MVKVHISVLVLCSTICLGLCVQYPPELQSPPGAAGVSLENPNEPETSETGFPEAIHSSSKYFQDIYMAQNKPEELEFGHVCESPHDWEQRFEKINFETHKQQGKVRWGDKHGGYGEHYWDYNHAGHHEDGDGSESYQEPQIIAPYEEAQETQTTPFKKQVSNLRPDLNLRAKRQPIKEQIDDDVEFVDERARSLVLRGGSGKHGGNLKSLEDYERGKREQKKRKFAKAYKFRPFYQ